MQACICWDCIPPIWGINNSSPFLFCVFRRGQNGGLLFGIWGIWNPGIRKSGIRNPEIQGFQILGTRDLTPPRHVRTFRNTLKC